MKTKRVFCKILGIPVGSVVRFRSFSYSHHWIQGRVEPINRETYPLPYLLIRVESLYYIRNESEVELIE